MQRHARQSAGRAGRNAEEIDEHALRRRHVGVHQDADGLVLAHGRKQPAGEFLFADHGVAVQRAIARDQRIEIRIVQRPHHDLHGMTLQRMEERANLPSAEMTGEQQHAFAALLRRFEIFEALIHRNLRSIRGGVLGKETGFAQQPAQRNVNPAQNRRRSFRDFSGKREFQITKTHPPQPRMQVIHRPPINMPAARAKRTWQRAN